MGTPATVGLEMAQETAGVSTRTAALTASPPRTVTVSATLALWPLASRNRCICVSGEAERESAGKAGTQGKGSGSSCRA